MGNLFWLWQEGDMAFKLKIQNTANNEVLEIPFYSAKIINPDNDAFVLNSTSFEPTKNSGIILYEDATAPLITLLDKYSYDELDTYIDETYKAINLKKELTITIRWTKLTSMSYTGKKGISVEIMMPHRPDTLGLTIITLAKGIETIGSSYGYHWYKNCIPFIDTVNKSWGSVRDEVLIMDIISPPGDWRYLLVKSNKYKKRGQYPYTEPYSYLEGSTKFPDKFTKNDVGKKIYNKTGILTDKTGYEYVFGEVYIPSYPDQNPDEDNGADNQPEPDAPIQGDGDTSSDAIPDPPPLPNVDVTDTGFVTVYNPNVVEIRQLAYFMWSGDFVDLIKKMFAEPFSALISLKLIYVPVTTGNSQIVWLGNVETGVSMKKVTQQFVDVDMGTLTISEFFGSFADYAPYTKVQIFLPFIGYKDLNVDEVMNAVIHLRYRIDVYSGACIAFLTVTKDIKSTKLNSILYQFDGNCSTEIPFTSNDNSRYVAAILNATTQGALSLASSSSVSPPKPQDPFVKEPNTATFNLGSLAPVANGMLDILSVKPNIARSGSLAGAIASMGVKQPYVIIHRPIQHMPANYQKYYGIPLNLTRTLSELSGYTVVSQVFIESAGATDDEVQMITTLLRNGVIL